MPAEIVENTEEAVLQKRSARPRLFQLDALRGLAAFCVIWYHLRLSFPSTRSHNPIIVLFTSGHQAVELFFVLSGYVLGMPFWIGKQQPYWRYIKRRFFRIYVPYFAAFLFAWACAWHFVGSHLPLTPWFHLTWQTPLSWRLFLAEVFMDRTPAINTAFWSLRMEAQFSILLPIFCWLVLRLKWPGICLLCVVSSVIGVHVQNEEIASCLVNYPMFFVGLLMSFYAAELAAWWHRQNWLTHIGLFVLGVGLYFHLVPAGVAVADGLTLIGAILLILCSLHSSRLAQLLRHSLPEYLGRISYSLYLVHGTVLFASINLLYGHVPMVALVSIYGISAMVIGHVFCVLIEEPAMRLGRRLTS